MMPPPSGVVVLGWGQLHERSLKNLAIVVTDQTSKAHWRLS